MTDTQEPNYVRGAGIACFVIVAALMVIGGVSHEVIRHVIQAAPAALFGTFALIGIGAAKWPAIAVAKSWFGIAALIWLYLLHIANFAPGTYSPAEIAMTFFLAGAGLHAFYMAFKAKSGLSFRGGVVTLAIGVGTQLAAMYVSFREPFTNDTEFCAAYHWKTVCSVIASGA